MTFQIFDNNTDLLSYPLLSVMGSDQKKQV
jgi:hypothetical protein